MKRKFINSTVLTVLTFLITMTCTVPVFALPSNLLIEDNIDLAENKLSVEKVIENVQYCDSEIVYRMNKLDNLKKEIQSKQDEIKENENNIKLVNIDIDKKDKQLTDRIKQIQHDGGFENNTIKFIDAVVSSEDILSVIQNIHLIFIICKTDKDLLDKTKIAKENLNKINKKIQEERKDLQESKQLLESDIKKIEEKKIKLLDYIKIHSQLLDLGNSTIVPISLSADMPENIKNVINEVQKYLGVPYLWGGTTPAGFDCSGLMQYVYDKIGISLPRVSQEQQSFAKKIDISQIKPGDLVFNEQSNSTHVGMYIGNDMYIHAPHTGDIIKISQLSTSNMKYVGRVLD